jgi:hypothetical protein
VCARADAVVASGRAGGRRSKRSSPSSSSRRSSGGARRAGRKRSRGACCRRGRGSRAPGPSGPAAGERWNEGAARHGVRCRRAPVGYGRFPLQPGL